MRSVGNMPIGKARSVRAFLPRDIPGCILDLQPTPDTVTFSTTLFGQGTTPPVLTISGTPNGFYRLYVKCSLLGVRGVWQFDWSIDGGATWGATGVVSAASQVLGTTGITLAIATGAAAINDTWDRVISKVRDRSGLGNDATPQVDTSVFRRVSLGSLGGRPSLHYPGLANQELIVQSLTLSRWTIATVMNYATDGYLAVHDADDGVDGFYFFTGAGDQLDGYRSSVVSAKGTAGSQADGASHQLIWTFDGTHAGNILYVAGSLPSLNTRLTGSPGVNPISAPLYIGGSNSGGGVGRGDQAKIVVYNRVLSSREVARLSYYLLKGWGA